ncbi:MAG: acetate/propionate family kinase [Planctomycetota bacterium]|jgi:acetate kinase|nr:acetate/propionate family kinase [Planctomycetota bacterium]
MPRILVVNIGSTSLKYRLLEMAGEKNIARGYIERIGDSASPFIHTGASGPEKSTLDTREGYPPAIQAMLVAIGGTADLAGIGFKVVQGGPDFQGAYLLGPEVLEQMEVFSGVMPAHNPPYIQAIRHFQRLLPGLPLVGAFETAFHRQIPPHAAAYGIPRSWSESYAIRRYGFHGASHRYLAERLAVLCGQPLAKLRLITCHLGGSSSLAAVRDSHSIDTSMGFTTQSGVPMAKRSADLDPFILPYLVERTGLTLDQITEQLTHNGGLAGISGLSGDMRDLLANYQLNPRARLAVDYFCYEVKKYLGAYFAVLNGVDAIAFSGGIGENAAPVREYITEDLDALGIVVDQEKNRRLAEEGEITGTGSRVRVFVIPTNEEIIVAREAWRVIGGDQPTLSP